MEVSANSDQVNFFIITRSTIEQTIIPENEIMPDSSQIWVLVSFLCNRSMSEGKNSDLLFDSIGSSFPILKPQRGHDDKLSSSSTPQFMQLFMLLLLVILGSLQVSLLQ